MAASVLRAWALLCVLLVCSCVFCSAREAAAAVEDYVAATSIQVVVNTNKVVNVIDDDTFLCVNMDWWPPTKCNYGSCPWGNASLANLDLENPILMRALQGLSPVTLRAGGTLGNLVVYDIGKAIPSEPCRDFVYNESALYGFTGGCLTMQRFDALNAFWKKAGVTVAFGLNNLYGRANSKEPEGNATGPWITTNTYNLVKYAVEKGYPITGWEIGNEILGDITIDKAVRPEDYADDIKKFRKIVDELYPAPLKKPLLIAPDMLYDLTETQLPKFLELSREAVVDVLTRHSYNLGPGATDPNSLIANILSLPIAQNETEVYKAFNEVLEDYPETVAWVGESGGAFNSGGSGVTNSYVMAFWYLDMLGKAAVLKNQAFCRQTFVGGFYGMIDTYNFVPNPDYYGALLWRKLMGKVVYDVSVKGTNEIRAYGHSKRHSKSGLTLLLLNYSKTKRYNLTVDFVGASDRSGVRQEYHMSAPNRNLTSKVVLLNGKSLKLTASGEIPDVVPRALKTDSSKPISVAPLSYAFITFRNLNVGAATAIRMTTSPDHETW